MKNIEKTMGLCEARFVVVDCVCEVEKLGSEGVDCVAFCEKLQCVRRIVAKCHEDVVTETDARSDVGVIAVVVMRCFVDGGVMVGNGAPEGIVEGEIVLCCEANCSWGECWFLSKVEFWVMERANDFAI